MTRLALANTFHDLPISKVRKMAGENLLDAYPRADADGLRRVADRIGVTPDEILAEPDLEANSYALHRGSLAFRTRAWD